MGQEQSALIGDDTLPETLSARTLPAVADMIKDGKARRIVVMTGAGISTAAGIPDFRSPGTGLYNNLARLNLPYAEAVFDINYFRQNPNPFYVLAKELYPGNFSPTVSHIFVSLLAQKGLLQKLFTQNIDCLEREAGVPGELIIEAHGSFATQRCVDCKTPYPDDQMKEHVLRGDVPRCIDHTCNGLVKPDIVFFGESLPDSFFANRGAPASADLVLVMGTSLMVQPFASLPEFAREGTPRVLFNLDRVGTLGSRADDVLVLEDCDSGVRRLADLLGWRDELEAEWRRVVGFEEAESQLRRAAAHGADLKDEVSELAGEVERLALQTSPPAGGGGVGADGADSTGDGENKSRGPKPEDTEEEAVKDNGGEKGPPGERVTESGPAPDDGDIIDKKVPAGLSETFPTLVPEETRRPSPAREEKTPTEEPTPAARETEKKEKKAPEPVPETAPETAPEPPKTHEEAPATAAAAPVAETKKDILQVSESPSQAAPLTKSPAPPRDPAAGAAGEDKVAPVAPAAPAGPPAGPVGGVVVVDPGADRTPGEGGAAVAGGGEAAVAGGGEAAVASEGGPAVAGEGGPAVADEGRPAVAGEGGPAVADEGRASVTGVGLTAAADVVASAKTEDAAPPEKKKKEEDEAPPVHVGEEPGKTPGGGAGEGTTGETDEKKDESAGKPAL